MPRVPQRLATVSVERRPAPIPLERVRAAHEAAEAGVRLGPRPPAVLEHGVQDATAAVRTTVKTCAGGGVRYIAGDGTSSFGKRPGGMWLWPRALHSGYIMGTAGCGPNGGSEIRDAPVCYTAVPSRLRRPHSRPVAEMARLSSAPAAAHATMLGARRRSTVAREGHGASTEWRRGTGPCNAHARAQTLTCVDEACVRMCGAKAGWTLGWFANEATVARLGCVGNGRVTAM